MYCVSTRFAIYSLCGKCFQNKSLPLLILKDYLISSDCNTLYRKNNFIYPMGFSVLLHNVRKLLYVECIQFLLFVCVCKCIVSILLFYERLLNIHIPSLHHPYTHFTILHLFCIRALHIIWLPICILWASVWI